MSEIFPTTIRDKGISLGFFSYFVGAITYTTPSALAFKNMYVGPIPKRTCTGADRSSRWRMYLLYMSLCIISTIIVYFYVPETKQIPIEGIGALFGDEVVVHLSPDGHGIVEDKELPEHGAELGNNAPDKDGSVSVAYIEKA